MEQCTAVLQGFPSPQDLSSTDAHYDQALKAHLKSLTRLVAESSSSLVTYGHQILDLLDPALHSLSYLTILHILLSHADTTTSAGSLESLLDHITVFFLTFDTRQIRYAGTYWSQILSVVKDSSVFPPSVGIDVLASALLRIDPSGSVLTTHHLALAKLAYQSGHIDAAMPVLEKPILFYACPRSTDEAPVLCNVQLTPPSYITPEAGFTARLKPETVMEYDLLVGLCHAARREWQRSRDAFERVVTYPVRDAGVISKLMSDAHAKWILVSLLADGEADSLPATTVATTPNATLLETLYQTANNPYGTLAGAFMDREAGLKGFLPLIIENYIDLWREDGNLGLVLQILAEYPRWQIVKLGDVYSQISMEEVHEEIKKVVRSSSAALLAGGAAAVTDIDVYVLARDMIERGMLRGRIVTTPTLPPPPDLDNNITINIDAQAIAKNQPRLSSSPITYIEFFPPAVRSEAEFTEEMTQCATQLSKLAPLVTSVRERIETSREWVRHMSKEPGPSAGRDKDGGGTAAAAAGELDVHIEVEDMMVGIVGGGSSG